MKVLEGLIEIAGGCIVGRLGSIVLEVSDISAIEGTADIKADLGVVVAVGLQYLLGIGDFTEGRIDVLSSSIHILLGLV